MLSSLLAYTSIFKSGRNANNNQNDAFSSFSTNLKGSASRLTRMAKQGDTVAVLKVAGIVVGVGLLLWIVLGWIF